MIMVIPDLCVKMCAKKVLVHIFIAMTYILFSVFSIFWTPLSKFPFPILLVIKTVS